MNLTNLTKKELNDYLKINRKKNNKTSNSSNKSTIIWTIIIFVFSFIIVSVLYFSPSLETMSNKGNENIYLIILGIFGVIIMFFFLFNLITKKKRNELLFNDISSYLNSQYSINTIPNYSNLSNTNESEIQYNNIFFNLSKLKKIKFIKNINLSNYDTLPFLTFTDNSFFINWLYLYTESFRYKYNTIYDSSVITMIKFNNSSNLNFILNDNIINWVKYSLKYFIKYVLNSVYWFWIIFLIIFFSHNKSEKVNFNERFDIILYYKYYIFLFFMFYIFIWLIISVINYVKMKKSKINIDGIDSKFDVFILNWNKDISDMWKSLINTLNDYISLEKNKWKIYNFFIDNNYLYIKYDLLKSWKKKISIVDYILEIKEHILLARELKKYYN